MPVTGQFPAVFNLADLNGLNGFKIDGEAAKDSSGAAVSAAGDVNGDGWDDLIIGAYCHPYGTSSCGAGRSYVVYGGPGVGNNGLINLSALNGTNGFKLDGESKGDRSGISVSAAADLNGDGRADLVIGADGYSGNTGRSYIVFGGSNVGGGGILPLANLNGSNGFKIDGESKNSYSGHSVSAAGDINGDGRADLIIGAYGYNSNTGRSYVVFGNSSVGSGGLLSLANLNGANGFKMDGESKNSYQMGVSESYGNHYVSAAGDVNGDGRSDLIIGADCYLNNAQTGCGKGRSYVLFGKLGIGSSGLIPLANLNGTTGFKLDGEVQQDYSGVSVSTIGDVNGDGHDDFIIGAENAYTVASSYVVFGQSNVGNTGLISLSNLNGTNGFKIDDSGLSVSSAGDINGDGWADLIIGDVFDSYVIFGGIGLGSNGLIALSNLTETSGFKLRNELLGSSCICSSVSAAGDINGDDLMDLIIGTPDYPAYNQSTGRSYVVFGDSPPVLVNNNLSLHPGDVVLLNSTFLRAYDRNHNNNTLLFVPSGYTHGHFEAATNPGVVLTNFTQQQITSGSIQFVHDGSYQTPSYNISVVTTGLAYVPPTPAQITFTNTTGPSYPPPVLVNNFLTVFDGRTRILSSADLLAIDQTFSNSTLQFTASNVQNGYFSLVNTSTPMTSFLQQNVTDGRIQFVSSGGNNPPSYGISVRSPAYNIGPFSGNITFYHSPVFISNNLSLNRGQSVLVNEVMLNVTDDFPASQVNLTISQLQYGQFMLAPTNNTATQFTQQQLRANQVYFRHDGSLQTPSYNVTVNDGYFTVGPQSANVNLTIPLTLLNNRLNVTNGQTVMLSSNNVLAIETGVSDSNLLFFASSIQNGYFAIIPSNLTATTFSQAQVQNGTIQFIHAANQQAPSYFISVTDGSLFLPPSSAVIQFSGAPVIEQNTVFVNSTTPVILTPQNLNITVNDGSTPSQVLISISDLQNGQIVLVSNLQPVSNFTLDNLINGQIELMPDNTNTAPSYLVTVTSNNNVSTAPNLVDTHYTNQGVYAPRLLNNYLFVRQGIPVTLTPQNLQVVQENGQPLNDSSALFLVSNVVHGQFTLANTTNLQISFFTQQQLQSNQVIFIQDASRSIPSYQAAVKSQGLQSASSSAQILFQTVNQPPVLAQSLEDQTAVVGDPWTYAIPVNTFTDPEGETLSLSVGLFNSTTNQSLSLPAWMSFNPLINRFSGIPDQSGVLDIGVTARDPEGLTALGNFALTVSPAPHAALNNSIQQAIISAVVTGGIGLGFVALRIALARMANKKLLHALGEGADKYDLEVVRPVAKEIARRVKITGCMNNTTNTEMANFKGSVRTLLGELDKKGINIRGYMDNEVKRDMFINTIATQARLYLVPDKGCCGCTALAAFFKAQATPQDISDAAPMIADAVLAVLGEGAGKVSMSTLSSSGQNLYAAPHSSSNARIEEIRVEEVEEGVLQDDAGVTAATQQKGI